MGTDPSPTAATMVKEALVKPSTEKYRVQVPGGMEVELGVVGFGPEHSLISSQLTLTTSGPWLAVEDLSEVEG